MSEFSFIVQKGRKKTKEIVDQLHELDHTQTKNFADVEEKLDVMKQYTSEMTRTFSQSGQMTHSFDLASIYYLPTLPTLLKSIYGEPVVEEKKEDNFFMKALKGTGNFIKKTAVTTYDVGIGGGIGLVDVGKDTVVGLYDTATDPIGTAESLFHSVTNPVETYKYIEKSIADSYERDMVNGDAESRSHWVTYALGTTATAVVGTKGAGALTKTGVATTKTAVQKSVTTVPNTMNTMQSSRLAQFLPYGPRTQVAMPGGVAFNVINGPVLKESLNMQAKKLPDSGVGLKGAGTKLESVPSVRKGEFRNWFNSLTMEEFDKIWADPKLRESVKDRLRYPGGMHEWHLVSRADTFKHWGVTAEQIAEMRTLISETKFVNPIGKHGGKGSTKAHNELLQIIDTSKDYDMFKRRLQNWTDYRFAGGSDALPEGLKPNRR